MTTIRSGIRLSNPVVRRADEKVDCCPSGTFGDEIGPSPREWAVVKWDATARRAEYAQIAASENLEADVVKVLRRGCQGDVNFEPAVWDDAKHEAFLEVGSRASIGSG